MITIKHIPNIITVLRILLSPVLLFITPLSVPFFILYFFIGLTDVLDGFIARRFNLESKSGAVLDSIADIIFMIIALYIIVFKVTLSLTTPIIIWIIAIAVIRIVSALTGSIKYHCPVFLHTYLNKATGFIFYFYPLMCAVFTVNSSTIFICVFATVASIEELIINIISKELNLNIRFLADMKNMR